MKQRKLAVLTIFLIIISGFTIAASAFYFDYQFFETDKLVYEVGESVNMVASLVADFSPDGYCFVSFSIVTDQGPAFADEYFILPSPNTRLINSTYVINPEQTQPGEEGITAYALFNVELYDSVTQGASDNIQFTINRGHLTTYPQTPLVVESDANSTLTLKVASIYNSNISYSNENVNMIIKNSKSETILNKNVTTDSLGNYNINWNQSMGILGVYDITTTGYGNEDFLGFSKTNQVSVVPTISNLTIVSAPTSVQCQSPDGKNIDYADIIVKHETATYADIDDSVVFWNASFGNGFLSFIGNGDYSASIPFTVSPGLYTINVSAVNIKYQTVTSSIVIEAMSNPLDFILINDFQPVTHSNNVSMEFLVEEGFGWNESISLKLTDNANEISRTFMVYPGMIESLTITAWENISIGPHNLTISTTDTHYSLPVIPKLQIIVLGELTTNIHVESAYYGETLVLNITALNYEGSNIEFMNISVYNNADILPFVTIQQVNTTQLVSIQLPLWINPGDCALRFEIMCPYYVTVNVFKNVTIMMRTNITIIVERSSVSELLSSNETSSFYAIASSNSIGSNIRPPPILFNGITSQVSLTTRDTSLDNCPKFNSGMSSLSTVLPNSLTA